MITGYVIKRTETDYVINCDAQGNGGYNVVPKEIDPHNAYTLEEVRTYLLDNPDMLLDLEAIESEKSRIAEIATLKSYLAETDYIYPKCLELGLDVNVEYTEVVQKRKEARARIQTLTQSDREVET
jgi:hypothetical protein